MKCLSCQADNTEGAKFCRKCGGSLQQKPVCPQCRHTNPYDSNFCEECNHRLTEVSPTPAPPPTAKLSADQFPGAEHQPLTYPGRRPPFSYVYYQGMIYGISPRGDTDADLWLDDSNSQITLDDFLTDRGNAAIAQRHAVLAVGSNGCPGRLAEKYAHQPEVAIPVFVGTLVNTVVVYSRRFASYGALPATYLYQPGASSWLSVTMLTDEQLARMDETEAVGEFHLRIAVPGYFRVKDGPMLRDLTAYLDRKILTYRGKPIRLKIFAQGGPDWPEMDEPEVLSLVFDQAGILRGETVEHRHRQLRTDGALRAQLTEFLDTRMSALVVDKNAQLVERGRPSITCSRVIRTDIRPGSEGTYIVRLSQSNSKRLKARNATYLQVRYGNGSVMAYLSIDGSMDDAEMVRDETVRVDQTLRTAIGLEPIMQGSEKKELIYSPDGDGDLKYPIVIQRAKFRGPGWITRLLKQQYLICVVHHAMSTDMETPLVRLTTRAMQVLGIEPGDKVRLINNERHKTVRCLPLDPKFQLPSERMETSYGDWKYELPMDEDLRLPWITMDRQTRLALDVQPWQAIIVGRNTLNALASEFSQVALAVALAALGGALVVDHLFTQLAILLGGFSIVSILIWVRIRSRI